MVSKPFHAWSLFFFHDSSKWICKVSSYWNIEWSQRLSIAFIFKSEARVFNMFLHIAFFFKSESQVFYFMFIHIAFEVFITIGVQTKDFHAFRGRYLFLRQGRKILFSKRTRPRSLLIPETGPEDPLLQTADKIIFIGTPCWQHLAEVSNYLTSFSKSSKDQFNFKLIIAIRDIEGKWLYFPVIWVFKAPIQTWFDKLKRNWIIL